MQILVFAFIEFLNQSHVILVATPHCDLNLFAVAGCNCIKPHDSFVLPSESMKVLRAFILQLDSLNIIALISASGSTPLIDVEFAAELIAFEYC